MNGNLFIRNPYLAMTAAIVIVLCGFLAMIHMPLAQYPKVTPPAITVTATYPGSDGATLLNTVIEPLEKEINGVPGLLYLSSTAANSGEGLITATFAIGTTPEVNRANVQSRVNRALAQLPQAVRKEGVVVREQSGNILLGISLSSPHGGCDTLFMSNYAAIHLSELLKRVPGVAQVQLFGGSDYAMRVWLDRDKCAALKLTVAEILDALRSQNLEVASGSTGSAPAPAGQRFVYDVRLRGRLTTVGEFRRIIVRSSLPEVAQVRLGDVAEVTLGGESDSTNCTLNGLPAVMILIFQQADANALEISRGCREVMEEASKHFPPDLRYGFQYDSTRFVKAGIADVVGTLLLALLLVSLVTLLFLGDWRMALIPIAAILVSVVGSFTVLYLLGFSINMVTLFALTLAIGIVVDDAIIVIENISRLMEDEKLPPKEAAAKSMLQITGAVTATTAVLLAMFVPICFFSGITGELYREFGVTISVAVGISALNALSLSPALSSIMLKGHREASNFWIFRYFRSFFNRVAVSGGGLLAGMLRWRVGAALLLLLLAPAVFYWYFLRPTGFLPAEDQGYFFGAVQLPGGASLERTGQVGERLDTILRRNSAVADVIAINGYDVLNSTPASESAFVIAILKPWRERRRGAEGSARTMRQIQMECFAAVPGALTMFFQPPAIPGIGMAGGFNFVLEERSSTDPGRLAAVMRELIGLAALRPELVNVFCAYGDSTLAVYLKIDRAKALMLGVPLQSIHSALENYLGYTFVNQFNRFGEVYKVETQGRRADRDSPGQILRLQVPNGENGAMLPLSAIASLETIFVPGYLRRYNLHLAAQIQGMHAPGTSSGEAMKIMEELAGKILPPDMQYEWTDLSYQEAVAGSGTMWIMLLAVGFIYLFLAALYQSWTLPLTVLAVILPALAGALAALQIGSVSNNIYTRIGMILLFGMACKTAILVVDFAEKLRREGRESAAAAAGGARLRFRAVLMTSLAFVLGTLPLALAAGPGSGAERSIGIPVAGGMAGAIFGALFLAPVLFALTSPGGGAKKTSVAMLVVGSGIVLSGLLAGCYRPPVNGALIEARTLEEAHQLHTQNVLPGDRMRLSRSEAVRTALNNNPDYRSAFYAITQAKMRYYQALGSYSPSLGTSVAVGQGIFSGQSSNDALFPSSDNGFYTLASVQAVWLLFDGLSREFTALAAKRAITLQEHLSDDARRLLTQAVELACDDVLQAVDQERIAKEDFAFQQEALRQARIKCKVGEGSVSDVLNFTGRSTRAGIAAVKAAQRRELARFALALLMGLSDGTLPAGVELENDSGAEPQALGEVEFYLGRAIAGRPDLNAVRESLAILKYSHYRSYSAYSPSVYGYAGYSYGLLDTHNNGNPGDFNVRGNFFHYGALAYWNIFDGFKRFNELRATRAELDRGYLAGTQKWLKAVNEVRSSHSDCRYALRLLQLAGAWCDNLRKERDLVHKEYLAGAAPVIRLNQVQDDFVKSQYELADSRTSVRKAFTRLAAAAASPENQSVTARAETRDSSAANAMR